MKSWMPGIFLSTLSNASFGLRHRSTIYQKNKRIVIARLLSRVSALKSRSNPLQLGDCHAFSHPFACKKARSDDKYLFLRSLNPKLTLSKPWVTFLLNLSNCEAFPTHRVTPSHPVSDSRQVKDFPAQPLTPKGSIHRAFGLLNPEWAAQRSGWQVPLGN